MGRLEGTRRPPVLQLHVPKNDEQGDKKELEEVVTESPALDAALAQASSRMQDAVGKGDSREAATDERQEVSEAGWCAAAASLCAGRPKTSKLSTPAWPVCVHSHECG